MHKFLNIRTGHTVNQRKLTELPISQEVLARVSNLAEKDKVNSALAFSDRSKHEIIDVDDIAEYDLSAGSGIVSGVMVMDNNNTNYNKDESSDNDATITGLPQNLAPEFAGVPQDLAP